MIQPIYIYGSEVLRKKAEPVDLNDKEGITALFFVHSMRINLECVCPEHT